MPINRKTALILALAAGVAGTAMLAAPSPVLAQSFYYSDSGVRVYVGPRHRHHHRHYYRHRYYDDYAYHPRRHRHSWNGCPWGYTVQDGVCKPYRGY